MTSKRLQGIEERIEDIKRQILEFDVIRPGSLTRQYRDPKKRTGAFFQVSYTHQMKSRTQYVRAEFVNKVRRQIRDYKRFRKLVEKWIALGIQHSQLSMKIQTGASDAER